MLLPAWLWILVTIIALVISVMALFNGLSTGKRVGEITGKTQNLEKGIEQCRSSLNRDHERLEKMESDQLLRKEAAEISNRISALRQNLAELERRRQDLEAEIERGVKVLDGHREDLKKLESERRQQESLRRELARLMEQVGQEEKRRDGYVKESSELQVLVSSLNEEHARLKSEIEDLQFDRDVEKEVSKGEEVAESIVKRRVTRKHRLVS